MRSEIVRRFASICFLLALSLTATVALGQNANTGEIKGTVSDATGAVVAGATVTITDVLTGVSTVTTTNDAGIYDAPSIPTGQYKITFSKTGFRSLVRNGITLEIQTIAVDGTLQVGSISEQVVVTQDAPLVETETSDQHVDLNTHAIESAPITGTDWRAEMIQLIPGVNTGGGAGEINGQGVGVNGTQSYNINFLSDGGPATAPRDFNGSNYYMPVDAIGEVTINSANANVQYGGGLTSINVSTKSGTNQWHGSGYEYIQNTALNSRGYFNPAPEVKSVEHWNTYGGSLGGPVIKNKLFFFFLYQRNPSVSPTSGNYSYPNAAEEQGDFFGISGATNPAFFDPTTSQLLVPQDTVAQNLQKFFPAANARGWIPGCPGPVNASASVPQTCPNTANDFVFNGSSPDTDTWYTGKADYNINAKQRLSFSFNYFPTVSTYVPADPLFPNDATSTQKGFTDDLTSQLSEVYTISPTVVNEFRIGASRELDKYSPPSLNKNDPTTIGLEPTYGTNAPANVFPKIQIDAPGGGTGSGCIAEGAGCGENGNISAVLGEGTYLVSDVLTLIRGRHTIKVGGEYDRSYQNYTNWGDISSGNFEFNGSVTGIPYADFLAGDVYGWYVYEYDPTSAHMSTTALFGSDDVKVSSHLTLNLGLRWQAQSGWGVKNNLFGNYDPYLPNSADGGLYKGAILFGGQGDTVYGGPTSNMTTIQNADYKEFAPRVGIAWSPRDKWSVRASYGIFDAPRDSENYTDGALGLGFNPHQVGYNGYTNGSAVFQLDQGPTPGSGLMVVFPTLQTLSSTVSNFSGVSYYPRSMPTTYVQNFLVSVQHEFTGNILLDTSYVYTRGRNLNFQTNINQAPINAFGCTGYNCGNPNPIFNDIQAQIYDGYSNYNALQLRLQKRTSYGVSFQVNYAWSKWLDTGTGGGHGSGIDIYQNAFDPAANYGLSDGNAANTVVGEVVYEVPFGRGRRYAVPKYVEPVAGGWRVSTLFQWHSGTPFTPVIQSGIATALDPGLSASINQGGSSLYPDVIGSSSVSHRSKTNWFNPAAFTNPAPGTFGDAGRNILTGPGFTNVDFSLAKEFSLYEAVKLEVRADMFDVFNHINWANPNNDVGIGCSLALNSPPPCGAGQGTPQLSNSTAGTITSTEGGTRIIQLGAHVRF
ncbi:MAG TPA: TonB-dependent receptor [Terriglobales bacterium]|nr:TonB-dependent receptor [Terriglobales bacterium]